MFGAWIFFQGLARTTGTVEVEVDAGLRNGKPDLNRIEQVLIRV